MSAWADITGYRQGEPRVPRWWCLEGRDWGISVGNAHIDYGDECPWLYTAFVRLPDSARLAPRESLTTEEAQECAAAIIATRLRQIADEIEGEVCDG